jgi:hypothetical protein
MGGVFRVLAVCHPSARRGWTRAEAECLARLEVYGTTLPPAQAAFLLFLPCAVPPTTICSRRGGPSLPSVMTGVGVKLARSRSVARWP